MNQEMDNSRFRILLAFEHLFPFIVHRFLIFIEIHTWKYICFSDSYFYGELWNEIIVVNPRNHSKRKGCVFILFMGKKYPVKSWNQQLVLPAGLHENLY